MAILLDANMFGIKRVACLGLSQVSDVVDVRKNGWSKLDDDVLIWHLLDIARRHTNRAHVFLTRDEHFFEHARISEQKIVLNGNLKVVIISYDAFREFGLPPKTKKMGNASRGEMANFLARFWPVILQRTEISTSA